MVLQDGVHFEEAVLIGTLAIIALAAGIFLYKDEKKKVAEIRRRKERKLSNQIDKQLKREFAVRRKSMKSVLKVLVLGIGGAVRPFFPFLINPQS